MKLKWLRNEQNAFMTVSITKMWTKQKMQIMLIML